MIQAYQGACHCGRVKFEVRAELNYVVDCNCSICRRTGALWHPAAIRRTMFVLAKGLQHDG